MPINPAILAGMTLTADEARFMARAVVKRRSRDWLINWTGATPTAVYAWLTGRTEPAMASRRAIFDAFVVVCRPDLGTTEFDLMTWGRFCKTPSHQRNITNK